MLILTWRKFSKSAYTEIVVNILPQPHTTFRDLFFFSPVHYLHGHDCPSRCLKIATATRTEGSYLPKPPLYLQHINWLAQHNSYAGNTVLGFYGRITLQKKLKVLGLNASNFQEVLVTSIFNSLTSRDSRGTYATLISGFEVMVKDLVVWKIVLNKISVVLRQCP